jgi:hypothetical protein
MYTNLASIAATTAIVGAYSITWTTSKLDPFYDFDAQSIEIDVLLSEFLDSLV